MNSLPYTNASGIRMAFTTTITRRSRGPTVTCFGGVAELNGTGAGTKEWPIMTWHGIPPCQ